MRRADFDLLYRTLEEAAAYTTSASSSKNHLKRSHIWEVGNQINFVFDVYFKKEVGESFVLLILEKM
ncbi:MAG: hypothetical protein ACUVTL_06360 [Thermoproteota archaeon]